MATPAKKAPLNPKKANLAPKQAPAAGGSPEPQPPEPSSSTNPGEEYGWEDAPPFSTVHSYGEADDGTSYNYNKRFRLSIYNTISEANNGLSTKSDNWRQSQRHKLKISSNVHLFPEEFSNFSFDYENQYEYPIEKVMEKLNTGGSLGKIKGLLEGLTAAGAVTGNGGGAESGLRHVSKYLKTPAWVKTSNLKLPSTITFNFAFGAGGIYDAYEEVVKPILALMQIFAPSNAEGGSLIGPAPTPAYVLASMVKGLASTDLGATDTSAVGFDLVKRANEVADALVKKYNKEIETISIGCICTGFYGGIYIPPFIVGGATGSFDFSELDEHGRPFRGKVTLKNCESVTMAHKELINKLGEGT